MFSGLAPGRSAEQHRAAVAGGKAAQDRRVEAVFLLQDARGEGIRRVVGQDRHPRLPEDRAVVDGDWLAKQGSRGVQIIEISEETKESAVFRTTSSGDVKELSLFDLADVQSYLGPRSQPVFLDITGAAFGTWAVLVRAALASDLDLKVLYVEPKDYMKALSPVGSLRYNLSERTDGISPLPGFARLTNSRRSGDDILVPLLGFEGDRLARIFEEVQPPEASTFPVIGLPGFRPEYPFHTIESNMLYLNEQRSMSKLRYARANCPFSLYALLSELTTYFPDRLIQIAVLGTKPHALGAALFVMLHPDKAALLYDHPIRSQGRTTGSGRLCVYDIKKFLAFTPILSAKAG